MDHEGRLGAAKQRANVFILSNFTSRAARKTLYYLTLRRAQRAKKCYYLTLPRAQRANFFILSNFTSRAAREIFLYYLNSEPRSARAHVFGNRVGFFVENHHYPTLRLLLTRTHWPHMARRFAALQKQWHAKKCRKTQCHVKKCHVKQCREKAMSCQNMSKKNNVMKKQWHAKKSRKTQCHVKKCRKKM